MEEEIRVHKRAGSCVLNTNHAGNRTIVLRLLLFFLPFPLPLATEFTNIYSHRGHREKNKPCVLSGLCGKKMLSFHRGESLSKPRPNYNTEFNFRSELSMVLVLPFKFAD